MSQDGSLATAVLPIATACRLSNACRMKPCVLLSRHVNAAVRDSPPSEFSRDTAGLFVVNAKLGQLSSFV